MKSIWKKVFLIFWLSKNGQALQFNDLPLEIFCFICIEMKEQDFLRQSMCSHEMHEKCKDKYLLDKIAKKIMPFSFAVLEDLPMSKRLYGLYLYRNNSKKGTLKGKKVISIETDDDNGIAMALTDKGEIYVWGENYFGILGLGHDRVIKEPTLLEGALKKEKVAFILTDSGRNFALTKDGKIYSWGYYWPSHSHGYGRWEEIPPKEPKLIKELKWRRVFMLFRVNRGAYRCITTDGIEYVWGNNSNDQLTSYFSPIEICSPRRPTILELWEYARNYFYGLMDYLGLMK